MKTSDFDYHLPKELIAQTPLQSRQSSRLLSLSRERGEISHFHFSDLPSLLQPGDRLVLNDTKVIPARIFCRKDTGIRIELLCTQRIDAMSWIALVKPARRLKHGMRLALEQERGIGFTVQETGDPEKRLVTLLDGPVSSMDLVLERYGEMPLPPYIKRAADRDDRRAYQTVYASQSGAVAAPTAGLHFTRQLMRQCLEKGIGLSYLTLHVGIGTFKPVKTEDPAAHTMHEERFLLDIKTAEQINATRKQGGRIVAVGTTSVRVLEHCTDSAGLLRPGSGTTGIFILPGYVFKCVDGLITNFHLPRSTLLMLVSAFIGRERILSAYKNAIDLQYRFFSYGDAMIIL